MSSIIGKTKAKPYTSPYMTHPSMYVYIHTHTHTPLEGTQLLGAWTLADFGGRIKNAFLWLYEEYEGGWGTDPCSSQPLLRGFAPEMDEHLPTALGTACWPPRPQSLGFSRVQGLGEFVV